MKSWLHSKVGIKVVAILPWRCCSRDHGQPKYVRAGARGQTHILRRLCGLTSAIQDVQRAILLCRLSLWGQTIPLHLTKVQVWIRDQSSNYRCCRTEWWSVHRMYYMYRRIRSRMDLIVGPEWEASTEKTVFQETRFAHVRSWSWKMISVRGRSSATWSSSATSTRFPSSNQLINPSITVPERAMPMRAHLGTCEYFEDLHFLDCCMRSLRGAK